MNDLKFAFRQLLKNPGFTEVAVLMLGLRAAAADTTDASALLPSPQTIVARHVEAVGGRAALLKHQSYHWTGGFELPAQKVSGSLEIFGKAPHKFWLKVEIPGAGKYLRATDGRTMWHFNPQPGSRSGKDWESHARQGLRRLADERQQHLTDVLDLNSMLNDETGLTHAHTVGRIRFQDRECLQLDLTGRNEQGVTEYFDPASGLRAGVSYAGTNAETFITTEYKEIGGVTIPTRVIRLDGERTNDVFTIISAESVLAPDSKFVLPIHVPDWPTDWNEMDEAYPPPTFAKQLPWPWKGEHSRWFNAKFDKPGDDFFWSYVVFNALEGDTLKSREELADALKRYDGSLYGDAFPPAKIRVEIGPDQDTWKFGHRGIRRSVTIDGFDAEATKKELTTHLEVFRWYCPMADRTGMLVLRSPRPFKNDDAVWRVLLSFWEKIECHATDQ